MHAVPSSLKGKYVIRYTVTSPRTTLNDIARDWEIIQQFSSEILGGDDSGGQQPPTSTTRTRIPLKGLCYLFFQSSYLRKLSYVICVCFHEKSYSRNQGEKSTFWIKLAFGQYWAQQSHVTENRQWKFCRPI